MSKYIYRLSGYMSCNVTDSIIDIDINSILLCLLTCISFFFFILVTEFFKNLNMNASL